MAKIRSYRGKLIDTELLFGADDTPAIGNMNVNAGGDIIDENGKVVKSRDEVAREYYKDVKKSVVTSSILDDINDDDGDFELRPDPKFAKKNQNSKPKSEVKETAKEDTKDTLDKLLPDDSDTKE